VQPAAVVVRLAPHEVGVDEADLGGVLEGGGSSIPGGAVRVDELRALDRRAQALAARVEDCASEGRAVDAAKRAADGADVARHLVPSEDAVRHVAADAGILGVGERVGDEVTYAPGRLPIGRGDGSARVASLVPDELHAVDPEATPAEDRGGAVLHRPGVHLLVAGPFDGALPGHPSTDERLVALDEEVVADADGSPMSTNASFTKIPPPSFSATLFWMG
jgi:hypothetical protein